MTRLRQSRSFLLGRCSQPVGFVARTLFDFPIEPCLLFGRLAPPLDLSCHSGAFGSFAQAAFGLPSVPLGFEWQSEKPSGRYLGIRIQHLPQSFQMVHELSEPNLASGNPCPRRAAQGGLEARTPIP
jgi:hypothetical protein